LWNYIIPNWPKKREMEKKKEEKGKEKEENKISCIGR